MAFLSLIRANKVPEDSLPPPFIVLNPDTIPEPNLLFVEGDPGALFVENAGLRFPNLGGGVPERSSRNWRGAPAAPERPVQVGVPMSI
jgi:hypothetical protein